MNDTKYKVINDSVHGHITLHRLCIKIIDTVEFQRLRNIKQLGVANLVYPGAGHSRFEHSLGVCHLARKMIEKLIENDQQWTNQLLTKDLLSDKTKLCVEVAGLCHDLGHGPFSHMWERVVKRWQPDADYTHESQSIKILDKIFERMQKDFERDGIYKKDVEFIKDLITGNSKKYPDNKQFLFEIIANGVNKIDVDKWDYLLRDGQYLNLSCTFDFHRLLEMCAVVNYDGKYHISYKAKEINTLYDLFRTRAEFHQKAYQHEVVKNIETMCLDAFELLAEYKITGVTLKDSIHPDHICDFVKLTDHIYYDILYSDDEFTKNARTLFENICNRHLYKLIGKRTFKAEELRKATELLKTEIKKNMGPKYKNFKYNDFQMDLCVFDEKNNLANNKIWLYEKVMNGETCVASQIVYSRDMLNYPIERNSTSKAQLLLFYDDSGCNEDEEFYTSALKILQSLQV